MDIPVLSNKQKKKAENLNKKYFPTRESFYNTNPAASKQLK